MPMPNKMPKFFDKHKICIICEGNEEYQYLKRLKDLKVWNEQYDISLVNAGGNGNIHFVLYSQYLRHITYLESGARHQNGVDVSNCRYRGTILHHLPSAFTGDICYSSNVLP